jgi:hypothetical protein
MARRAHAGFLAQLMLKLSHHLFFQQINDYLRLAGFF